MLDVTNTAQILEKVERLTLSLSHHGAEYPQMKVPASPAVGRRHADDVLRLMASCARLDRLDLHWYKLFSDSELTEAHREEEGFLPRIMRLDGAAA